MYRPGAGFEPAREEASRGEPHRLGVCLPCDSLTLLLARCVQCAGAARAVSLFGQGWSSGLCSCFRWSLLPRICQHVYANILEVSESSWDPRLPWPRTAGRAFVQPYRSASAAARKTTPPGGGQVDLYGRGPLTPNPMNHLPKATQNSKTIDLGVSRPSAPPEFEPRPCSINVSPDLSA